MPATETCTLACDCGARLEATCCITINAERDPEVREALLARTLHQFTCDACGKPLAVEKTLAYLDLPRREFYSSAPERDRANERKLQEELVAAWNLALGERAPNAVKTMFRTDSFQVRLTFGLEELREKVVARDAGCDDLALEIVKAEVMASHPEWAALGVRTLRLDHVEPDGRLAFLAERASEPPTILEIGVLVDRSGLDELAKRPWGELLERYPGIAWGSHVSLLRLAP